MPDKIFLYAGSFDPVTIGHADIIERASRMCSKLYVAVLTNTSKKPLFDLDERVSLLKDIYAGSENIEIMAFDGLMKDLIPKIKADVIVRGIRNYSDFEYGMQSYAYFEKYAPGCETILFPSKPELDYISSSLVREHLRLGGSAEGLVPGIVDRRIGELYQLKRGK
jgi:pantetheine-phosphate adenylyltransferase